ncbi:uncharacterized protein LOC135697066 [Ochlerotatus camptorhynchus]|uniref:uncharacterized protein LOC135697066 n=1 Tax=Ochlerotatus camptorhynchus TaxID=644619 RepID=UPI0031E0FC99
MQRQLQRDPEKYVLYHKYVEEFLENNHITRIAPDPNHPKIIYLAHHGVIKAESSTTKLRVVFNAAKNSSNGLSLNDLLATGPIVQDTLYNLLMNFRLYPVVLTSDLTKMFLQVKVTEEDSERIRILWQEFGQPMAEYGLNTVTFGMSCALFLATRTLNQLGEDEGIEFPLAKEAIKDFYVDDLLIGAATREEAKQKRQQITEMMKRGGFEIRKWASNDREVLDDIPPEDRAVSVVHTVDSQETIKTLGVQWQHREDLFTFKASDDPIKECFTKREVLSTIAKIFDPLGLIGPIVVIAKMMMQELWKIQTDWSEPLPNQFNHRWRIYLVYLRNVWQIKVPRRCISVPQPVQYHLHGFCDASLEVYGAAVYLRAIDENGDISSHLLGSKSRVAPINRPSLPRLELCAATLLAELIKAMKSTLRIPIHQTLAFSDSTTTLAWIAGDPARWKIYVANRVATINTIIPASDWRHVPTKQNPADLLTHGVAPCVLALSKLWWHEPDWEPSTTTEAPVPNPTRKEEEVINTEVRRQQPILAYLMTYRDVIEDILHKYSSYTKLLRVTAWIIRFSENCQLERAQRTVGPLSVIEINAAKRLLIRYTQHQAYAAEISALEKCKPLPDRSKLLPLSPFVESNLLRVGGRLARSNLEYTAKHPLIIPAESRLATIIFNHEHLRNHHLGATSLLSAVRETFWVPHGRKLARNTIWKCVPCHKNAPNRGMLQQIMGQLPETRVTPAPPFFHCALRRANHAVHLEAVSKLSTKAFLAAMRRFVARRGHCGHMYSDNGTNFVGADNEMRYWYRKISSSDHNNRVADFLAMGGTQWHFNPPGSPHMGGLWEAAIKSAKHHLNIVTQKARLTFEEFGTLLAEIESILNSRPISPASNDPNDLQPLTPGHFLIGRPLTAINEQDYLPSPDEPYDVRFRYVNELRQHFWDRWSKEYIPELQLKGKWHRTTNTLEEGDLVLVRQQKLPVNRWVTGRIQHLHGAPDGNPRLATVKTSNGEIVQSVHNLIIGIVIFEPAPSTIHVENLLYNLGYAASTIIVTEPDMSPAYASLRKPTVHLIVVKALLQLLEFRDVWMHSQTEYWNQDAQFVVLYDVGSDVAVELIGHRFGKIGIADVIFIGLSPVTGDLDTIRTYLLYERKVVTHSETDPLEQIISNQFTNMHGHQYRIGHDPNSNIWTTAVEVSFAAPFQPPGQTVSSSSRAETLPSAHSSFILHCVLPTRRSLLVNPCPAAAASRLFRVPIHRSKVEVYLAAAFQPVADTSSTPVQQQTG